MKEIKKKTRGCFVNGDYIDGKKNRRKRTILVNCRWGKKKHNYADLPALKRFLTDSVGSWISSVDIPFFWSYSNV